jgi:hypothetical protein
MEVEQTDSKRTGTVLVRVKTKLFCPKGQKGRFKMKWLNCAKIRLVLVVFVVAIVIGGGRANADLIWGRRSILRLVILQIASHLMAWRCISTPHVPVGMGTGIYG